MDIPDPAPLFAWGYLEESPSLQTIDQLLRRIPDGELLAALRAHRGHGRNDYPVEVCWGVLLLTIALRHDSIESCLNELQRNVGLRLRIGIEREDDVPKPHNMSRFLKVLGQAEFLQLMRAAFNKMVAEMAEHVGDLGRDGAGDSTALKARRDRGETPEHLPQPSGGRKEYTDDDGTVSKVLEWFGYKLHLLVDARHELVLGYEVTGANTDDGKTLPTVLDQAQGNLPEGRMQTLSYDKAADNTAFHNALKERAVAPVVQARRLWKGEPYRELPGNTNRPVGIYHDEFGTVYCCDNSGDTPVYRPMAYTGYERTRGTLKYRCPALAYDQDCPLERICNKGKCYGLTVRAKHEIDPRRFPIIPRSSKTFERHYKARSSVERVNARLKLFWGMDDGNIGGAARFHAHISAVLLVHLAFGRILAEHPRRSGILGTTRLGPVQEALRQAAAEQQHQAAASA